MVPDVGSETGLSVEALQCVLKGQPHHADAIHFLGVLLHHQGLLANSRTISLWSRNLQAREQVLRALVMLGENDEAAKLYREWLAQEPDNPVALHQMAAIDPLAHDTPARASDAYIETVFDSFAPQFEAKLQGLPYRAPELVANALMAHRGNGLAALDIADPGCGTGLCGPGLRPMARHLVACADTLCYFGAPKPDFSDYRLRPIGRYAHCTPDVLRQEAGQPVAGWLVTATMPARASQQASRS